MPPAHGRFDGPRTCAGYTRCGKRSWLWMSDESYALSIAEYGRGRGSHWYFLGANIGIYLEWTISGPVGALLGTAIPDPGRYGLDLVFPLAFLKDRISLAVALGAGGLALLWVDFLSGKEMPYLLRRWLRYVPGAVLAALVAPAALAPQRELELGLRAWATLAGAAVAWHTRNVLLTILGGMATFWLLRALGV